MRILLTNDDGIHADGLRAMYHALVQAGHEVYAFAPETEQSGVSGAITFHMPLRVREIRDGAFTGHSVSGTPVDCVKLALTTLLPARPELVVSGINAGSNLGGDVYYSGTLGAAVEGAFLGLPALAVSRRMQGRSEPGFESVAQHAADFIGRIAWAALPPKRVLNLNFPACPVHEARGLRLCPLSLTTWDDAYLRREDPRGRPYWWLHGELPPSSPTPRTDSELVREGWITLTPLQLDLTDAGLMTRLAGELGTEAEHAL